MEILSYLPLDVHNIFVPFATTAETMGSEEVYPHHTNHEEAMPLSDDLAALLSDATHQPFANAELPESLKDLPHADIFTSTLSIDLAVALGIPIFGATEGKFARRIYIQEYLRYKDIDSTIGNVARRRFGVGIRWIVNFKLLHAGANITSIASLANATQTGQIEASARFQILGLQSQKISTLLPPPGDLNVTSFADMQEQFSRIIARIDDPQTIVAPQLLAVLATVPDPSERAFEEPLATIWGLTQIAEGKSLQQAEATWKQGSPFFYNTLRSLYFSTGEVTDRTTQPEELARIRAQGRLLGFQLCRLQN